jgi:hypothetical protein
MINYARIYDMIVKDAKPCFPIPDYTQSRTVALAHLKKHAPQSGCGWTYSSIASLAK